MPAPLQIVFHGIEHSDAIDRYVRARATKLEKLGARIVACRVAVEQPHRHARHGAPYRIRIDVTVPGGEVVTDRAPPRAQSYKDPYAAVDAAFDDAVRRLGDFVRRQRGEVKEHENGRRLAATADGALFARRPTNLSTRSKP